MRIKKGVLTLACVVTLASLLPATAVASQKAPNNTTITATGTYNGSGGTLSDSSGTYVAVSGASIANTDAKASFTCNFTSFTAGTYGWKWTCSGGTITITSASNDISFKGTFTSGSMTYSGSGGGRGGKVTYWYIFSGNFSGTLQQGGTSSAVTGTISADADTTTNGGQGAVALYKMTY